MAQDKKSFILYVDQKATFDKLTDEQAGKLIKHVFNYCEQEGPEIDDPDFITGLAFTSIKQQLKRDLVKYEAIRQRNQVNGGKGGRPKKPKEPTGLTGNPKEPKKAVNVNVNDTVNVNDNKKAFTVFWDLYDYKVGKPKALKKWEGINLEDQKAIIEYLPKYKLATPDKKYRKHPATFLNSRSWEDEIINTDIAGPAKINADTDQPTYNDKTVNYGE